LYDKATGALREEQLTFAHCKVELINLLTSKHLVSILHSNSGALWMIFSSVCSFYLFFGYDLFPLIFGIHLQKRENRVTKTESWVQIKDKNE